MQKISGRLLDRLQAQPESSPVDGHHSFGPEHLHRFQGVFGAHVHRTERKRPVVADGQKGQVDGKIFADLLELWRKARIPAEVDGLRSLYQITLGDGLSLAQ